MRKRGRKGKRKTTGGPSTEGPPVVFLRKIVLEIPILFLLNRLFPLYGLAYAQFCAEFVLACAAVFVLVKLFSRLSKAYGQPETKVE